MSRVKEDVVEADRLKEDRVDPRRVWLKSGGNPVSAAGADQRGVEDSDLEYPFPTGFAPEIG